MKKLLVAVLVLFSSCIALKAQYNSVGYDESSKRWNVNITDFIYTYESNEPTKITAFNLTIENKTMYSISAIDVEIVLEINGKIFFKKTCQVAISPSCAPGEIQNTRQWFFGGNGLLRSNFGKKFTWSAKVVQIYEPT